MYTETGNEIWKSGQYHLFEKAGDIYNKQTRREEALNSYDIALQFAGSSDWIGKARLNRKKALCFEAVHSASKDVISKYHDEAESLFANENNHTDQWYQEWLELQLDKCWEAITGKASWMIFKKR